jgi:hypothetical protein
MREPTKKPVRINKNGKPSTSNNPDGRTPKHLDLTLIEGLAQIHCTDGEIASIVGVSHDTFQRRKQDNPEFAEMLDKARANGKASLRRIQWHGAQNGSAAMAIWLGKQLLGQKDRHDEPFDGKEPLPWSD